MDRPRLDTLFPNMCQIKAKRVEKFDAENPRHIALVLGRTLYLLMDGIRQDEMTPEAYERLVYWIGNAEASDLEKLFSDRWVDALPQEAIDACYTFIREGVL